MRVLHLISSLGAGGAENLVRALSIEMGRCGHKVGVIYFSSAEERRTDERYEQDFARALDEAGVERFHLGHATRINAILGAARLWRIARRFRPDVLHVHIARGLILRLLCPVGLPTVYTHHSLKFNFPRALFRAFDVCVRSYVAISDASEAILNRLTRRRVVPIRNGISGEVLDRVSRPRVRCDDVFEIVTVGSLVDAKDYDTLLAVASRVSAHGDRVGRRVRFRVAGEGAALERFREKTAEMKLQGRVEFLGVCSDVPGLLATSDLYLMTSVVEGLPLALIEAAMSGLPIVATDVGGCKEVVVPGYNGELAPAKDIDALTSAVLKLWETPARASDYGKKSREHAAQFSIERCASEHLKLYANIADQRR